jgi:hypothetical protein
VVPYSAKYIKAILSRKWDHSHSSSVFNAKPSTSKNISGHPSSGGDHTPSINNMGNASSGGSGGKGVCRKKQTSVYTPPPEGGRNKKTFLVFPTGIVVFVSAGLLVLV